MWCWENVLSIIKRIKSLTTKRKKLLVDKIRFGDAVVNPADLIDIE
jgi:hypothetical protein